MSKFMDGEDMAVGQKVSIRAGAHQTSSLKSGAVNSTPLQSRTQCFSYHLLWLGFYCWVFFPPCDLWVGSHKNILKFSKGKVR